MRITQYAVNRRLATSAIATALVVLGLYGLSRLPVDFLPDVTYPMVKMQIRWPGATPEEIDKDIADPLERLMATVDGLDSLESFAREGVYSLNVNFDYGTDVDVAFQDVLAALTRAGQDLPEDIEPPFVYKADPSQLPVVQLSVSSPTWGPVQLREWADNWLQARDHVSPFDAVINAAKIRLRPRIMTTLTTMMGFLPLALNIGEGGDMLQPMAIGAIGGLLLEMPVALLLMPCLYTLTATRKG